VDAVAALEDDVTNRRRPPGGPQGSRGER